MSPKARARNTDPATSHEAAERVREFEHTHWGVILAALSVGEGTAEDIAHRCGLEMHAVGKRLPELEKQGRAAPTARVAPTSSGRKARVWEATNMHQQHGDRECQFLPTQEGKRFADGVAR